MLRRLTVIAAVVAGAGLLAVMVAQLISGIDYRIAEDRGIEPGLAPAGTVVATEIGLLLLAVGTVTLVVLAATALIRQARIRQAQVRYAQIQHTQARSSTNPAA
ncbi:hypothetical protein D9V34_01800 [Mycetocola lacteus]|uniref:Uncharacterized protein n=1 Tax=Mycetocola lacteus TaxID=76637 RepID=A0A3L7AW29_9MICO|nr:hypothetical protein [Mycetocola lacteus]RLP84753.1 hypothetical protein D9V34_01800 [Mycetocola lacteus]